MGEPMSEIDQMIEELSGATSADDRIRLEILRYTRSMVLAASLECHFLNFVERGYDRG
jgi:hypothetical protein